MLTTAAQGLTTVDEMHREGLAADIHQGLLVLQGNIADNWRCQLHLASALPHLPSLLSPDVLAEHWAPYAFNLLLNGAGLKCSGPGAHRSAVKFSHRQSLSVARQHHQATIKSPKLLVAAGAAAVKPAAAHGLVCLLRGCRRERPRTDLYCRVMRELAWGRSCFARLAFTQLCVAALSVFSCRWFKEHLLLVS